MSNLAKVEQEAPQQLATVDNTTTMLSVIERAARDPNVDIDKMERLMQMQERMLARQAESAFNDAMSDAQAKMRPISADATNPQTRSKYATYGKLDKALRPIYTDHGFALSFDTGRDAPADCVRVLCYVSHRDGHSRTYHVDMPSDGKGAKGGDVMTKTHAVGAGMSYGMRYLLKMIFNVAVGEDDDDGNYSGPDPDSEWLSAINGCADETELASRKRELVAACGGVSKVPIKLQRACTAKAESLRAGK